MVVRPLPFVVADILQHINSNNLPQHERKVLCLDAETFGTTLRCLLKSFLENSRNILLKATNIRD